MSNEMKNYLDESNKKTCSTCSSVILRNGEPPPMAAYPSLLLGARTTEINFAKGH